MNLQRTCVILSAKTFPLTDMFIVHLTETNHTSISFETEEEARDFMQEPDYDMIRNWDVIDNKIELETLES